jgi:hypothetical protein
MKPVFVLAALLLSFGAQAQDIQFNQGGFGPGGRFGQDDRGPRQGDDWQRGPRHPGQGPDWGRPDRPGRGDQQVVSCASGDRRPNRCFLADGLIRDVRLVRQLSRAACVEGRTFGFDRNSIWVTNGCRGEFLVTTERGGHGPGRPGPGPRPEPRSELVHCKSSDYRYASCGVRGQVEAIRVERQYSSAACIEGRTFGLDRNAIWVNQGCEATFRVYLR